MRMRSAFAFACFCGGVFLAGMSSGNLVAQTSLDKSWQEETQSRLRDVYERGTFRPKRFQAEWLPDSSGYLVREHDPESNEPILVRYDVRTGKRIDFQSASEGKPGPDRLSPDGTRVLEFYERNLFVHELATGQKIQLMNRSDERDIWYRQPAWSPDGKRIVFVESDMTDVKLRSGSVTNRSVISEGSEQSICSRGRKNCNSSHRRGGL